MIRLGFFVTGAVLFLASAASNFERIPMPVDFKSIVWTVGPTALSLDVIMMVVGVFLMLIGFIFHRLAQ